jgi:hypothetical protein
MSYSRCARFRLIEQKLGSAIFMRPQRGERLSLCGVPLFTVLPAPAALHAQRQATALLLLRHRAQTAWQAGGEEAD